MHSGVFLLRSRLVAVLFLCLGALACRPDPAARDVVPPDEADGAAATEPEAVDARPAIVFLGTSLTAGYGLEDPDLAFPSLLQERIDSLDLDFRVVNAGLSGDTSAGGLERLPWLLESPIRVLVLELGANDGLRGLDPEALQENLVEIMDLTRTANPGVEILLAGMEAPPNLGARYVDRFRAVFPEVASSEDAALIPFLLDGVAGMPELNQDDRIHPTEEGHRIIAETVWQSLRPLIEDL